MDNNQIEIIYNNNNRNIKDNININKWTNEISIKINIGNENIIFKNKNEIGKEYYFLNKFSEKFKNIFSHYL